MRSTNPREVSLIFREYARKIHARAVPSDPNFIRLSVACCKVLSPFPACLSFSHYPFTPPQIEQWCEHYYPSFVLISAGASGGGSLQQSINPADARGATFIAGEKREQERLQGLRMEKLRADIASGVRQPAKVDDGALREFLMYLGGGAVVLVGVIGAVVYLIMQLSD
jgi:farnesyl-diphosphate farnesyltransferase